VARKYGEKPAGQGSVALEVRGQARGPKAAPGSAAVGVGDPYRIRPGLRSHERQSEFLPDRPRSSSDGRQIS
jgi:hypothetical protein